MAPLEVISRGVCLQLLSKNRYSYTASAQRQSACRRQLTVYHVGGRVCDAAANKNNITLRMPGMGPTYDILIADDHPLFRSALRQALVAAAHAQVSLTEVGSITELQSSLDARAEWDLVLLDLNMPGAYGFSGLVLLRGQYPHIPVVVISAQEEPSVVNRARDFGASGFIPKSSSLEEIQDAVRTVLEGGVYWPTSVGSGGPLSEQEKIVSAQLASLTPQQFRVLTMVCDGLLTS